jgi:hypothetical protein
MTTAIPYREILKGINSKRLNKYYPFDLVVEEVKQINALLNKQVFLYIK